MLFFSVVLNNIKAVDDIKEVAVPEKKHPPRTKTAAAILCHYKTPKPSDIQSFDSKSQSFDSKRERDIPGESGADVNLQRVANKTLLLFAVKLPYVFF